MKNKVTSLLIFIRTNFQQLLQSHKFIVLSPQVKNMKLLQQVAIKHINFCSNFCYKGSELIVTFLLSLMFTKMAKVTQARVFAKRNIITYFHLTSDLKSRLNKKKKINEYCLFTDWEMGRWALGNSQHR